MPQKTILGSLFLVMLMGISLPANSSPILLSEESSFGVWEVVPFQTSLTAEAFYGYEDSRYNGNTNGGPIPTVDHTMVFLVDASDGLSLFIVHDAPEDGSGGSAHSRWELSGDTAAGLFIDDPGSIALTISNGGTQFDYSDSWSNCCTDGVVIGSLDGNWSLAGEFLTFEGTSVLDVRSATGNTVSFLLADFPRIQLMPRLQTVPEPGGVALFTFGLAGIGLSMRRSRLSA